MKKKFKREGRISMRTNMNSILNMILITNKIIINTIQRKIKEETFARMILVIEIKVRVQYNLGNSQTNLIKMTE